MHAATAIHQTVTVTETETESESESEYELREAKQNEVAGM